MMLGAVVFLGRAASCGAVACVGFSLGLCGRHVRRWRGRRRPGEATPVGCNLDTTCLLGSSSDAVIEPDFFVGHPRMFFAVDGLLRPCSLRRRKRPTGTSAVPLNQAWSRGALGCRSGGEIWSRARVRQPVQFAGDINRNCAYFLRMLIGCRAEDRANDRVCRRRPRGGQRWILAARLRQPDAVVPPAHTTGGRLERQSLGHVGSQREGACLPPGSATVRVQANSPTLIDSQRRGVVVATGKNRPTPGIRGVTAARAVSVDASGPESKVTPVMSSAATPSQEDVPSAWRTVAG